MTDAITVNEISRASLGPSASLTTLEREKEEKKLNEQNIEEILETGQENRKKGIKAVQEINKDIEEKREKRRSEVLNTLDSKREFDISYNNALAQSLADILALIEWLPKWSADVVVTNGNPIKIKGKSFNTRPGVLLIVYRPDGGVFHRGITVTHEPPLDYAAVYNIAMQAENTMDEERKYQERLQGNGDSGIVNKYGEPLAAQPIIGA